ncbi:sensor histidine kinase [Pedobacter sp. SG918]|uniref:sensor histidine kinase n=1 Tax=Pedobacter sp. SG918 TaxID=2587136 RepID=UPI0017DFB73A|nr:ATP-binding protein [Pedobacter sp. SG918]NMN36148.1 signal transduction histidine kinase [Pedobacter sp. SG918]
MENLQKILHTNISYTSIIQRIKPTFCLLLGLLFCLCNNIAKGQMKPIERELQGLPFIKDSVKMVNSLNRLGTLYRSRNIDSCFYYGVKAKRMATNLHYLQGQTDADQLIAYVFFKRGLYAESLGLLGKILPDYQELDDAEKIIRVYLDMVEVLNKGISDRPKIKSLLQRAIQTGKKLKKDSIMAEVYMNYCNRNSELSTDSIYYYIAKSREIASRYKDDRMLIYIRLWEVRLLILNKKKQETLPLIKQLISDSRHIDDPNLEINSLFLMTGYYEDKPKIALDYYYQAYEIAQRSGNRSIEIYVLNNALEVANQLRDKDEIIKIHIELEKAMSLEWERSKKFISDYVKYNNIEDENKLLSAKNARRAFWLLIVSSSAAIIVLIIYLIMLRRSKKSKAQIDELNNAANMQIIAMEEAKHHAVREEQQRLGQDLHDSLASSIAAVRHQLEALSLDTSDITLKNKLNVLLEEIGNAYKAARNKSHEWFSSSSDQQEQIFEEQIKLLTDNFLPESRYNKDIHIDNSSLMNVDLDTRIALLRIIQEAITNIIKHARANNVGILIYEEEGNLILTINDDGIGLNEKKSGSEKSSIGLQSIRRRVQSLNGETKIHSDSKGTEITVSIPLAPW